MEHSFGFITESGCNQEATGSDVNHMLFENSSLNKSWSTCRMTSKDLVPLLNMVDPKTPLLLSTGPSPKDPDFETADRSANNVAVFSRKVYKRERISLIGYEYHGGGRGEAAETKHKGYLCTWFNCEISIQSCHMRSSCSWPSPGKNPSCPAARRFTIPQNVSVPIRIFFTV